MELAQLCKVNSNAQSYLQSHRSRRTVSGLENPLPP